MKKFFIQERNKKYSNELCRPPVYLYSKCKTEEMTKKYLKVELKKIQTLSNYKLVLIEK